MRPLLVADPFFIQIGDLQRDGDQEYDQYVPGPVHRVEQQVHDPLVLPEIDQPKREIGTRNEKEEHQTCGPHHGPSRTLGLFPVGIEKERPDPELLGGRIEHDQEQEEIRIGEDTHRTQYQEGKTGRNQYPRDKTDPYVPGKSSLQVSGE